MKLVDECFIELKAGNGGNGIVAWRREAHNPYGGPYGGDGGDGGDIIVFGDHNVHDLLHLKNHKRINGGKGGHGNGWFANAQNKIPNLYENGDIGESLKARFVIKYMSDIGLVGLPNAGKSTLISAITSSRPKIANYEFTTLNPILGICEYKNTKMVVADIPGLISGASKGKGLGHEFLKHIERCSILIHLISLNIDDNIDIEQAYKTIQFVANKIDCENAETQLKKLKKVVGYKEVLVISAKNKTNIQELINRIYNLYVDVKKQQIKFENKKKIKIIELKKQIDYKEHVQINQIDDHTWEIKSKYLEYWSNRIPLKTNDNIIRFNQKIKNLDVENKIKKLGGAKGDTLLIYGNEMVID